MCTIDSFGLLNPEQIWLLIRLEVTIGILQLLGSSSVIVGRCAGRYLWVLVALAGRKALESKE